MPQSGQRQRQPKQTRHRQEWGCRRSGASCPLQASYPCCGRCWRLRSHWQRSFRRCPVFASAGLGLSLPACIQGEFGLSAVHSGVEVIGRGAVLVAEPTREDIASRDCGSISVPTLADLEGSGHAQPLSVVGESLVEAPPSPTSHAYPFSPRGYLPMRL